MAHDESTRPGGDSPQRAEGAGSTMELDIGEISDLFVMGTGGGGAQQVYSPADMTMAAMGGLFLDEGNVEESEIDEGTAAEVLETLSTLQSRDISEIFDAVELDSRWQTHTGPFELDEDDLEILELDELEELSQLGERLESRGGALDTFDVTGMKIVDVAELEPQGFEGDHVERVLDPLASAVVEPEEIAFLESGIFEIDEDEQQIHRVHAPRRPGAAEVRQQLRVRLESVGGSVEMRSPWARLAAELRLEIGAEEDDARRASYLYIFAWLLRLHGPAGEAAALRLEDAITGMLPTFRPALLEGIARAWREDEEEFWLALESLKAHDAEAQVPHAQLRRAALVAGRLIEGLVGVSRPPSSMLEAEAARLGSVAGIVATGLMAHRKGDVRSAARAWRAAARYVRPEDGVALLTAAAALGGGAPSELEEVVARGSSQVSPPAALWIAMHEAGWAGDLRREWSAATQLCEVWGVGRDDSAHRVAIRAAVLARSAQLSEAQGEPSVGERLREAMSVSPEVVGYARHLERWARRTRRVEEEEWALSHQLEVAREPAWIALLHERQASLMSARGADANEVQGALERAISCDPGCLSAILSLGHQLVKEGDWGGVSRLRSQPSIGEASTGMTAWRRADLLELGGGDDLEISALYQSALASHPGSLHAFWGAEASMARSGQWRGLTRLYDEASSSCVADLGEGELESNAFAVGAYIEGEALGVEVLRGLYRRGALHREEGSGEVEILDPGAWWAMVAACVGAGGVEEAALRVDEAVRWATRTGDAEEVKRARLWRIYINTYHAKRAELSREDLRELFEGAAGVLVRRFAWHGLLRLGDAAWLADAFGRGAGRDLLPVFGAPAGAGGVAFMGAFVAELRARAGEFEDAVDGYVELAGRAIGEDRAGLEDRALALALGGGRWDLVYELLLTRALRAPSSTKAALLTQLSVASDVAGRVPLERQEWTVLCDEPAHALSLLEGALRRRAWSEAWEVVDAALQRAPERFARWRTTLTMWSVSLATWGGQDRGRALRHARRWAGARDTDQGDEHELFALMGAWYKLARLEDHPDAGSVRKTIASGFGESAVAFFDEELTLTERGGAQAARWYGARVGLGGPVGRYAVSQEGCVGWLYGERGRSDEQALERAVRSTGAPFVTYVAALAQREARDHGATRRHLGALAAQTQEPALATWGQVRELVHLATAGDAAEDGLAAVLRRVDAREEPWALELRGLLLRASGRPGEAGLASAGEGASSRMVMAYELALASKDVARVVQLAEAGMPAACVEAEVRAAKERRDWRAGANLELMYVRVRRSKLEGPMTEAKRGVVGAMEAADPCVVASPWCPMRLVGEDIARWELTGEDIARLVRASEAASVLGGGRVWRLRVAVSLARQGRAADAAAFAPDALDESMASRAWFVLSHRLGWMEDHPRFPALIVEGWVRRYARHERRGGASSSPGAWVLQVARAYERAGDSEEASRQRARALQIDPGFVPAMIEEARRSIAASEWDRLINLWQRQLSSAAGPGQVFGLSFRLGFVLERRLGHREGARAEALERYRDALAVQPDHVGALYAALGLAWELERYDVVSECASALTRTARTPELRAAMRMELAVVHEQHSGDASGALERWREAFDESLDDWSALLGILRTDSGERSNATHALERVFDRHQHDVSVLEDFAPSLLVHALHSEHAAQVMRQAFPNDLSWRLCELGFALSGRGTGDEALRVVREGFSDDQLRVCFVLLEEAMGQAGGLSSSSGLERLLTELAPLPTSEGVLAAATARALRERDDEALSSLARANASRASAPLEAAACGTWLAMLRRWSGHHSEAMVCCERVLERHPQFLPAVSLARVLAAELHDWATMARYCARLAELSREPALAARARVEASEIQRRHLGDSAAAREQLVIVLRKDPDHAEAFSRLIDLLRQAGDSVGVLRLCEGRVSRMQPGAERVEMLNEMADIAMNHLQDRVSAARYLSLSLRDDPSQLRRLRILAEIYEALERWQDAVICYDAGLKLVREPRLRARMLTQCGEIFEGRLEKYELAAKAYSSVLELEPSSLRALQALARTRQRSGDMVGALAAIDRLGELVRTPDELKEVRVARLELSRRAGLPADAIAKAARDVLTHHPERADAVDALRHELDVLGRSSELEGIVRGIVIDAMDVHAAPPLEHLYQIAKRTHLTDLAFCLSALGALKGRATREMHLLHESSGMATRWPDRPLPPELTAGVLPEELSVAFFEVIRRTHEALDAASDPNPYASFIKRRARSSSPRGELDELAWRWPSLFGLDLKDVYTTHTLPMGSAVVFDDSVRLILDRSWVDGGNPTRLLVRLGVQLAGQSMGVGLWSALGREAQVALFSRVISQAVPGWGGARALPQLPAWFKLDKFDRWLQRHGDTITPYALEFSGKVGPAALPAQFMAIELGMERLSCALMPDPASYLPVTVRFGQDSGQGHRPWAFVFSPVFARIRHAIGLSI